MTVRPLRKGEAMLGPSHLETSIKLRWQVIKKRCHVWLIYQERRITSRVVRSYRLDRDADKGILRDLARMRVVTQILCRSTAYQVARADPGVLRKIESLQKGEMGTSPS